MKNNIKIIIQMLCILLIALIVSILYTKGLIHFYISNNLPIYIFIVLYGSYTIIEQRTSTKTFNSSNKYYLWTRFLLVISWYSLIVGSVLYYSIFGTVAWVPIITGVVLFLVGTFIRLQSKLLLQKYFTSDIQIESNHKLVRNGLYRYIRHPGYLGNILQSIAIPLMLNILILLLLSMIFICTVFIWIFFEEKVLCQKVSNYKEYQQQTKMLIPFII